MDRLRTCFRLRHLVERRTSTSPGGPTPSLQTFPGQAAVSRSSASPSSSFKEPTRDEGNRANLDTLAGLLARLGVVVGSRAPPATWRRADHLQTTRPRWRAAVTPPMNTGQPPPDVVSAPQQRIDPSSNRRPPLLRPPSTAEQSPLSFTAAKSIVHHRAAPSAFCRCTAATCRSVPSSLISSPHLPPPFYVLPSEHRHPNPFYYQLN